jgi:CrcB protein
MAAPCEVEEQPPDPRLAPGRQGGPRVAPLIAIAIAVGGGIGAAARHGVALLWPAETGEFPWITLAINLAGCAALGALMVLVAEARAAHPLLRPFCGTGVLGGFTTFSTYAVETLRLPPLLAAAYLLATPCLALSVTAGTSSATRRLATRWRRGVTPSEEQDAIASPATEPQT